MSGRTFYILDVFAEERFAGNQLAVVRNAGGLSDDEMQKISKEMNYSETTFITDESERNGGYDVRIFTPEVEVPFAGHPTLGTAFIIQQEIITKPVEQVKLNLKVGQIPVDFTYKNGEVEELWMKQNSPSFGVTLDNESIAEVLGIARADIDDRFPIMEVSTGIPFIIVPIKTLKALKHCWFSEKKFTGLIDTTDIRAFLMFCPEPEHAENDLHARVFAHYYGVPEDAATGSANGCLAAYIVRNNYFDCTSCNIRVEQGYEIGRPSLLRLRGEEKGNDIDVFVGGKVILVAEGTIF